MKRTGRMIGLAKDAVIVVVVVVAILGAMEVSLRLFWAKAWKFSAFVAVNLKDDELGHRLKPNSICQHETAEFSCAGQQCRDAG